MPEVATLSCPFEQLREGDAFATPARTVTEADVASFGAQTGNLHPPADDVWPSLGDGVVPGLLTLTYAFGLVGSGPPHVIALRAMSDVVFTRPVLVGDSISVRGRIGGLMPMDDETGLVSMTLLTSNQHGKTVCRARIQVLWARELSANGAVEGGG